MDEIITSFSLLWAENEDVPDRLPALTAVVPWAVEAWNPALEEEVSQPYLASPYLDEDRAFGFVEPLIELKDVFVWRHLSCC